MEGVRVFSPSDWEASGTDGTTYVAGDLKKCLEGLARHLFGKLRVTAILNHCTHYLMDIAVIWVCHLSVLLSKNKASRIWSFIWYKNSSSVFLVLFFGYL